MSIPKFELMPPHAILLGECLTYTPHFLHNVRGLTQPNWADLHSPQHSRQYALDKFDKDGAECPTCVRTSLMSNVRLVSALAS